MPPSFQLVRVRWTLLLEWGGKGTDQRPLRHVAEVHWSRGAMAFFFIKKSRDVDSERGFRKDMEFQDLGPHGKKKTKQLFPPSTKADYWYGRLKKHYHNTPPEKILKWPENERACRKIKEWKTCVGECHWLYDEIRSDGCCTHEKELRNGPRLEPCNLGITNWEDCVGNCTWWNRFQCK